MPARALLALVVLALAGSGYARSGAGWKHGTLVGRAGTVEASLSYERRTTGDPLSGPYEYRDMRLIVRRAGRVVLDSLLGPAKGQVSLTLRDVWGSADPEALVEIQTGGNTCCSEVDVGIANGRSNPVLFHNFGMGWRGQSHAGRFDFVSSDYRFYCAFSDCASSSEPPQVLAINGAGDRFINVTHKRDDLVAADATQQWHEYIREHSKRNSYDPAGVLAPWCADEHLLGHAARCDQALTQALADGYLDGWHHGDEGEVKGGKAFIKLLDRTLAAWGYE